MLPPDAMATTDRVQRSEDHARAWRRPGLVLFAVAWGANQFVPLLLVYRARLALDAAQLALLFGMYALGLVPGLLLAGPVSDRRGRRAVALPAACVALVASLVLGAGGGSFGALLLGRLLYGLGAGGAMSAGAAWVVELGDGAPGAGARRATIALSAGFGLGPLVSGAVAQYLPAPTLLPYALHAALLGGLLIAARGAPISVTAPRRARCCASSSTARAGAASRAAWCRWRRSCSGSLRSRSRRCPACSPMRWAARRCCTPA
jgi:MFS family permease